MTTEREIFDMMIDMEIDSKNNPNMLQTYEVMWNNLKQKMQFLSGRVSE